MTKGQTIAEFVVPIRKGLSRQSTLPWSFISIGTVLIVWWMTTKYGLVSTNVLPRPQQVLDAFVLGCTKGFGSSTLFGHVAASLARLFAAFIIAAFLGVPLGLFMGTSNAAREIIDPWIQLYKPVPSLAYIGLMVLWLGLGETSRVALLVLAGLPPIVIGTTEAVRSVLPERINGARSLGVEGLDLFRTVIFPSCLPGIITAMRIASTGIFTTLIAAEMIGANTGIGKMVLTASYTMQLGMVVVGVVTMGTMGVAVDQLFRRLQNQFVAWAGRF